MVYHALNNIMRGVKILASLLNVIYYFCIIGQVFKLVRDKINIEKVATTVFKFEKISNYMTKIVGKNRK